MLLHSGYWYCCACFCVECNAYVYIIFTIIYINLWRTRKTIKSTKHIIHLHIRSLFERNVSVFLCAYCLSKWFFFFLYCLCLLLVLLSCLFHVVFHVMHHCSRLFSFIFHDMSNITCICNTVCMCVCVMFCLLRHSTFLPDWVNSYFVLH